MRKLNRGPNKRKTRIRLKEGDKVAIIAGADKGKGPAEVIEVLESIGAVRVKGVNERTKHLKRTQENPQGGVETREMPVAVSNVALWSPKLERGVRVRVEERDGKKVRVGVPCGTVFE
ncbi:MAG: 50S ribosomal protein L24 [Planctomycetes bacterium]|nr:50S ribosomal protein L24 [Planctomycetota bacterium]